MLYLTVAPIVSTRPTGEQSEFHALIFDSHARRRADYGGGLPEGVPAGRLAAGPATGSDAALAAAHLALTPNTSAASALSQQQPEHATTTPRAQQQARAAADSDRLTPSAAAEEGSYAALHSRGEGAAPASGKPPERSGNTEQKSWGRDAEAAASGKAAPQTEPCALTPTKART